MPEIVPFRIRRNDASAHLASRHGLIVAPATLAKLAVIGGGPAFYKPGARTVLYDVAELDRWASEKLGRPRVSTSNAS